MATMTFVVEYNWSGKKPNIFRRKMYEAEYAKVNNWLKLRTKGEAIEVSKLEELIQAYCLVNNGLKMSYSINTLGELIGVVPDTGAVLSYQLGQTV